MEERMSIRECSKSLKKYGSTARHVTRNDTLIRHNVSKTDTLQGIALKYGVTTEQIRRINRLWASDSLFLREFLYIPVPADSSSALSPKDERSNQLDSTQSIACSSRSSSVVSSIDEENSANDFMAKLDSSIASIKKELKRAQSTSEFIGENSERHVQRRVKSKAHNSTHGTSNSHGYSTLPENDFPRPSSSGDIQNLPSAVVMTQGKRVKTSLQKLQQQQDEMFQL